MAEEERKNELKELKELVEALKESIIELRSTLSELNNPFNIMKEPGSNNGEEEEEKHQESPLPLSASPVVAPYPVQLETYTVSSQEQSSVKSRRASEAESNSAKSTTGSSEAVATSEEKREVLGERVHETDYEFEADLKSSQENILQNLKKKYANSIDTSRLTRLLRTLYIVRSKLPREAIEDIVDVLLALKLIRPDERKLVAKLIDLVDKTRSQGLTPEDTVVIMYVLSKSLGVTDAYLEDEAFKSILKEIAGG